jgi:hypothetical protein
VSGTSGSVAWRVLSATPGEACWRTVQCWLACGEARRLLTGIARRLRLRCAGFRPGQAPAAVLYAQHRGVCETAVIDELRANPPQALRTALSPAFTPPEFRALPWDAGGDFQIEASFFVQPAAPAPGGRFAHQEARPSGSAPLDPQTGVRTDVAVYLPSAVQRELAAQGVALGVQVAGSAQQHWPGQPARHRSHRRLLVAGLRAVAGLPLTGPSLVAQLPGAARQATIVKVD